MGNCTLTKTTQQQTRSDKRRTVECFCHSTKITSLCSEEDLLAILELLLPLLDQLSGLPQVLYLVAFSVRYPARQSVWRGPHLAQHAPVSKAIVDQGFRSGVFIGDASGSFPVGQQVFFCLRGLALEVVCASTQIAS